MRKQVDYIVAEPGEDTYLLRQHTYLPLFLIRWFFLLARKSGVPLQFVSVKSRKGKTLMLYKNPDIRIHIGGHEFFGMDSETMH